MTLIAGFKCVDGYVICADTQHTVLFNGNSSRVSRQKLTPINVGGIQLAIAGSGDGDLIDAFVVRLERNLKGTLIVELDSVRQILQDEIASFVQDKQIPPLEIGDHLRFMIAAHSPGYGSALWIANVGDPIEVKEWALVGYDDQRYSYAVSNLYRTGMPISQGIFLGLYVMWLAEQTVDCVRAPITVAILKDNGIYFEDQAKIDSIDRKVRLFSKQFESQFLACSDTGIQNEEFAANLTDFGKTLIQFRQDFISEWVEGAVNKGLDTIVESWNEIPTGTTIVLDAQSAEHQRIQQMLVDVLRQNEDGKQSPERIIANLEYLKVWVQRLFDKCVGIGPGPSSEEEESAKKAFDENMAAANMGAYKTTPEVVGVLLRVNHFMQNSLGFGLQIDLQVRLMCLCQSLDFFTVSTPSASHSSGDQP